LDLGIYAIPKVYSKRYFTNKYLNPQTIQIIQILSRWGAAIAPYNVNQAFHRTGIMTRFVGDKTIPVVDISASDNVRHLEKWQDEFSKAQFRVLNSK
jgi:hypothetical protein